MLFRVLLSAGFLTASLLPADDWAHWRGQSRDGHTAESSGWDEGAWNLPKAPVKAWEMTAGQGSSSPLVSGGRVFLTGWDGGRDTLRCVDLRSGKVQWEQSRPAPRYGRHAVGDQGFYGGPSATPEFDAATGLLYTLGCDGDLCAWPAAQGGPPVWEVNLHDKFPVKQRPAVTKHADTQRDYGFTSAPLVQRDSLLVEVGSTTTGTVAAFDKRTGQLQWTSELKDPAGHAGGMLPLTVEGKPALVVFTSLNVALISLDAAKPGATLALRPWPTRYANNMATPVAVEGDVIITTKWTNLTARLRPTLTKGWETVWEAKNQGSNVTTPVLAGGNLYFAVRGLTCMEAATGKVRWKDGRFSDATSLIACADQRLITWSNGGDLGLIDLRSPGTYQELAWLPLFAEDMAWPHVVLADRHLLCRGKSGKLICLRLAK